MKTFRCRVCRKPYEIEIGFPSLCPECLEKEKDEYNLVRSYVRDRPGVTVDVVERDTKVDRQKIIRYLHEERLEIYSGSDSFLRCKICGSKIYTGMYCDKCKHHK